MEESGVVQSADRREAGQRGLGPNTQLSPELLKPNSPRKFIPTSPTLTTKSSRTSNLRPENI